MSAKKNQDHRLMWLENPLAGPAGEEENRELISQGVRPGCARLLRLSRLNPSLVQRLKKSIG